MNDKVKSKKLKDVCSGDVLYLLSKRDITDGIQEITVKNVTTNYNGELIFETTNGNYSPSKSSVSKSSFTVYNGSVVATSRESLLKASEKLIKKLLDQTDVDITEMKSRLDYLIENRKKIYRLYLDVFTS
jgi:hypothetical protein